MEAYFENENFWITQTKMSELFDVDVSGISRHISNIFADGELDENNNLHFLQIDNSKKPVAFYSLDVVIAVDIEQSRYELLIFESGRLRFCVNTSKKAMRFIKRLSCGWI